MRVYGGRALESTEVPRAPIQRWYENALYFDLAGVQKTKWAERIVSEAPEATLRRRKDLSNSLVKKWSPKPLGYCQRRRHRELA